MSKYACAGVKTLKEILVLRLWGKRKQLHGIEFSIAENVFKKI